MSAKKFFNITNGPSNHQLVDALKYAYDKQNPHFAIFSIQLSDENHMNGNSKSAPSDMEQKVVIHSLSHEDGSGYSFCFDGTMDLPNDNTSYHVSGYYHSKSHKGNLRTE